jgi:hypothetical protein
MCPMKLRLAVLAAALLLPFTACAQERPATPRVEVGDTIPGRLGPLKSFGVATVVTPAGRLGVGFASPVNHLEEDDTTDLVAREAPAGATFLPIVWTYKEEIFGQTAEIFGDSRPLKLDLVVSGDRYDLLPPTSAAGKTLTYVTVKEPAENVSLKVTYDGVTQTVNDKGEIDKGVATRLYDLSGSKARPRTCPIKKWFTQPGVFPQYTCEYSTAVATPYVVNTWAKPGHTWLAVTVTTNLAAYAVGEIDGDLSSYRIIDSTELSTIRGEKALGTLDESITAGAASGTLVFDVRGRLPKTMHLLREYRLTLSGVSGRTDAPEKRTVRIGGDVDLFY